MRKRLSLLSVTVLLLYCACQNTTGLHNESKLLNERTLAPDVFTIDVNRDTVLQTGKGGIITIAAGTFKTAAKTVQIEIKEAYSAKDMALAGLVTKAGNELLSSGGMMYLNTVGNDHVTIAKPISVAIPTAKRKPGMQLYKGEKKPDGTIDWKNPQPLGGKMSDSTEKGKVLFTTLCSACHNPYKESTGPPIAFIDQRRDWDWIKYYMSNPAYMSIRKLVSPPGKDPYYVGEPEAYASCLFKRYNTMMPSFPKLKDEELHQIFNYVNYLNRDTDPATIPDFKKSFDSCALYVRERDRHSAFRSQLVKENGPQVKITNTANGTVNRKPGQIYGNTGVQKPIVQPKLKDAEYYQFTITETGWYNIDILVKNLPGFENSTLMVRIIGNYKSEVNVTLLIPSEKIILQGGRLADKTDEYGFFTDDGKIPLPQGKKAIILAYDDNRDQVYFGKTEFVTRLQQTPEILVAATTKDQMNLDIQNLNITDIDMELKDSKNADALRKTDKKMDEIESLKPKNFDCECWREKSQTDTASMDSALPGK